MNRIHVLAYANNQILTVDGRYFCSTEPGSADEMTDDKFEREISLQSALTMSEVVRVELPEILPEDYRGNHAIIELAERMGYFKSHGSIFQKFDADFIRINDDLFESPFPYNWRARFAHSVDYFNDEGPNEILLFISEKNIFSIIDIEAINYRISFDDFCGATWVEHDTWLVNTGRDQSIVSFP